MENKQIELLPEEEKTVITFTASGTEINVTTFDPKFVRRLIKANATLVEKSTKTGKHIFTAPKNMLMLKTVTAGETSEEE